MKSNIRWLLALVALIVAAAAGVYLRHSEARLPSGEGANASGQTSTTDSTASSSATFSLGKGVEYSYGRRSAARAAIPAPDLNRPLTPPPGTPPDIASSTLSRVRRLISTLRKDTENAAFWNELGVYRSAWRDYDGAQAAWEYAAALSPQDAQPLENLAVMTGYELHDYPKAEAYFKAAIKSQPANHELYLRLFEFYRDIGNTANAKVILRKGLSQFPGDSQFEALLREL